MLGEPPVPLIKERPVQKGAISHQSPLNTGLRFAAKASKARRKSFVAMQIAWACASISIAVSRLTAHSVLSCVLVMPWAKVGPLARLRASNAASSIKLSAGTRRLWRPHVSPDRTGLRSEGRGVGEGGVRLSRVGWGPFP